MCNIFDQKKRGLQSQSFVLDPRCAAIFENCDESATVRVLDDDAKNKYASAAENLAQVLIRRCDFKVVNGQAYIYTPDEGRYAPVEDLSRLVYQALDAQQRRRFRIRDLGEVATRILYTESLSAEPDDFNADTHAVNLVNGVLSLSMGMLADHSPDLLFTYRVNANYLCDYCATSASHPTFDAFCATSLDGDAQKKTLLLEILGAIMSDCPVKAAFFLLGASNSGKSVILDFISSLLGPDMVSNVPLHLLASRFNLAEIYGKKVNAVAEIKGRKLFDITTLKGITASDLMQAERKGKDPFVFRPRAKLLFAGNVLPDTAESDATDAFANRLVPLLFNRSIPDEEKDPDLLDKLLAERDAIATDALNAFAAWLHRGRQWTLPPESIACVNRFRKSKRSDRLFIDECCALEKDYTDVKVVPMREHNVDLFDAYTAWCRENSFDQVSRTAFFATIDGIDGIEEKRFRNQLQQYRHGRVGIMLKANLPVLWSKKPQSLVPQGNTDDHDQ